MTNRLGRAASMALTVAALGGVALSMSHADSGPEVGRARFNSDGSAIRPIGWRQWVHVGTRYKPIGLNITGPEADQDAGNSQRLCRTRCHGGVRTHGTVA
jgi:hypothetical protein